MENSSASRSGAETLDHTMSTEIAVLEALYDRICELPSRQTSTGAHELGYRAALARARVFVLDERAGVLTTPV